jgi:hypothetical protein
MKCIRLHALNDPNKEIELDAEEVIDMAWASFSGGSILHLKGGKTFMIDENPNHVALMAGFISGDHCAIGSKSGRYHWGKNHDAQGA